MAATKSLQDILGWVALTKAAVAVKDGVPNPFPPFLFEVASENKVIGNSVKFNRTYGTKKTARAVGYGAPPRHRELQQEELIEAKFISFSEERIFDPLVLQVLRNYENFENGQMAKQLVANNIKTMGTLFGNARIVTVATTLAQGNIYLDSESNLLPTSSGAAQTFSQQISSTNNIGSILDGDSNGIFGATGTTGSWANPATNIPVSLARLAVHASQQHGYVPRIAIYGKNVPGYMIQNDYVLDFLARNPTMQTQWLQNKNYIPDGLFDLTWVPGWMASYTKDDGTKVTLWPDDRVTFMPAQEDFPSIYSMFEGSMFVPSTIDIQTGAESAIGSAEIVHGLYSYSVLSHKPIALSIVMGDNFFPAIKVPEAFYLADVIA